MQILCLKCLVYKHFAGLYFFNLYLSSLGRGLLLHLRSENINRVINNTVCLCLNKIYWELAQSSLRKDLNSSYYPCLVCQGERLKILALLPIASSSGLCLHITVFWDTLLCAVANTIKFK